MKSDSARLSLTGGALAAAAIAALILLFTGSPLPAQEETPAAPAEAAPSVSEILEDETFRYEPAGRRDPFRSLMVLQEKAKDFSMLPPVQQIELSAITITGIVLDEVEGPRAMIKAGGRSFVVKKGMIVGRNEGEVTEVTMQGIRIVEKFVDFMGKETLKETFIKARPDRT